MLTVLFRAILHHLFMELMSHIATTVGKGGVLSVEFTTSTSRRNLSLCFWEKKKLVMRAFTHCSEDISVVKDNVLMVGQLISVISIGHIIIICGGAYPDFIKALDKNSTQYPFNLSEIQLEKLLHKLSFRVMGKIDMFSKLRTTLVRFPGMLEEPWEQSTRFLKNLELPFLSRLFSY